MDSEKMKDTSVDRLSEFMTGSVPKPPTQGTTRARAMPVSKPGKGTTSETSCRGSLKLVALLALVCTLLPPAMAADISCQGIRYIYFNKGLDTSDIPRTPQQGERGEMLLFGPKNGDLPITHLVPRYLLCRLYPVSPISDKKW